MEKVQKNVRRKRGIVLSTQGINRLKQAIRQAEAQDNEGRRYNSQELSERADVSKSTISRLWTANTGIDRRTLNQIFCAFGLQLTESDVQSSCTAVHNSARGTTSTVAPDQIPYPTGPVPLNSPLYIPRPPVEERAYHEITQPGCVLRIKAPSGFGKSSLVLRVLERAAELDFGLVSLDLKQLDASILSTPEAFLRWFCCAVALKLGHSPNLDDHWSEILGNSLSTTLFIREVILEPSPRPVLLNIQEFDRLFAYPATSQVFLPLLRSWHEEARHDVEWQHLRQVVSYATDSYLPLDINQSPFNVGLPLLLPEFNPQQVNSLANLHNLYLSTADWSRLNDLIGGHPILICIAFYHLCHGDLSLDELVRTAPTVEGIFHNYLQAMLVRVKNGPDQLACLKELVIGDKPIAIDPILAYQLEATGLIKSISEGWVIGLSLYRDYLRNVLF
jgi:transcriptional regulator with XRE-family HTH domain